MTQNHQWELIEDVMVTQTIEGPISDDLYVSGFVEDLKRENVQVIFSVATGASSLTATQRKAVAEVMTAKQLLAIVITDHRVTRGIITAVSWLGANAKAFSWDDKGIEKALEATGATERVCQRLREIALDFRKGYIQGYG